MKYILQSILLIAVLAGCSKWNQDPMSGQNDLFKAPQEKPQLPEKPEKEGDESVKVDSEDSKTFSEGESGELTISARVFRPDYVINEILIENMDEFRGARFDAKTGKFNWTVPPGTIPAESGTSMETQLRVTARATSPEGNKISNTKLIRIYIVKTPGLPVIISTKKAADQVREGEYTDITVVIKDKDAGVDMRTWPTLILTPSVDVANLSGFTAVESIRQKPNNEFEVTLRIDLSQGEFTSSYQKGGFTIRALSALGRTGSPQDVTLDVYTSFAELKSTWKTDLSVNAKGTTTYDFVIFDPKGETRVEEPTFEDLPEGMTIDCSGGYSEDVQNCKLTYMAPVDVRVGDRFDFSAEVDSRNTDWRDQKSRTTDFRFHITVVSGGQ